MAKAPKPQQVRRETLARLAALSNEAPTPEYNAEYTKQVDAEKNDRGAVLLIGSNLENILETALSRLFHHERFPLLLGNDKPAGSFFNKIVLGYAIDLYGQVTFDNLDIVRSIRNAFAHAKIPISFETPQVVATVNLLDVSPLYPAHVKEHPHYTTERKPYAPGKEAFHGFKYCCHWIASRLAETYIVPTIGINPDALKVPLPADYGRIVVRRTPLP